MTPVMYHYVRPDAGTLATYPYLALRRFRPSAGSPEWHARSGDPGGFRALGWGGPAPDGYLLTFDDGLRDHVDFVLPTLRRRGVFGLFYVPSAPTTDGVVLDVHKLHLALGHLGGPAVLARLEACHPQVLEGAATAELGRYAG